MAHNAPPQNSDIPQIEAKQDLIGRMLESENQLVFASGAALAAVYALIGATTEEIIDARARRFQELTAHPAEQ